MLNILISNDDGIYAEGINTLSQQLETFSNITVVAPDRNRSGASNSLTLSAPLRIKSIRENFVMVEGTPTDCVHLAITGYLKEQPNMVVAGINEGANLGDDVLYSGTVAAAMEGRFLGLPALAFSLVGEKCINYDTAAKIAEKIIRNIMDNPLPPDTILNINVPDLPYYQLNGIEITRLGHRHKAEPIVQTIDPRGKPIYWVGPVGNEQDAGPGTDFHAIKNGFVSITPLRVDLTKHEYRENLKTWIKGVEL